MYKFAKRILIQGNQDLKRHGNMLFRVINIIKMVASGTMEPLMNI
jgi:hypothetical protein